MAPIAIFSCGIFILYAAFMIYFFFGLVKLKNRPSIKNTPFPTVSVVIAARNEEDNIRNLIKDLSNQSYPQNKLEIIISNDRSTDNTWKIIQQFYNDCTNIRGINISKRSPEMTPKKYALTRAIEASTGEIIISTDADCRVPYTWVNSIVETFDNDTGVVVGYSKIDTDSRRFFINYQSIDFLALMTANAGTLGWENPWTGSGQNIAYRRASFEQVDGFWPVSEKVSGDDFYLVQAISKIANVKYNINSESFITTKSMDSIPKFINQRIRWASNTRKLFKTPSLFLLFLFVNLFANAILLFALLSRQYWQFLPALFGIKFLFDSIVVFYGSKLFETKIRTEAYLIWFFLQPIYTVLLGILSIVGKYRWKE